MALSTKRKRMMLVVLGGVVCGMVGLSFAAVPLYDLFCSVTGFGGTTQTADAAPAAVSELLMQPPPLPPKFVALKDSLEQDAVDDNAAGLVDLDKCESGNEQQAEWVARVVHAAAAPAVAAAGAD